MDKPLISIVIPIYNVEKYLTRCIDSVINQTYSHLDIILVNDGSKDNSGNMCDEYKNKDFRIRVIHKKNGGLSDARNEGIDIALGQYITFIDSDDFVATDYVEFLYKIIMENDADISGCYHRKFFDEQKIKLDESKTKNYLFNGEEAIIDLCYQKLITNSAWGKLYKMKLFKDIRYPVGRLYEDLGTTYKLFLLSEKVVFSLVEKYYYFQRNDSIMHYNFSIKNMDRIIMSEELYQNVFEISEELRKAALARVFISNIQVLREMPMKNEEFTKEFNTVKNNIMKLRQGIILNNNVKKINRIIALSTYLGMNTLQRLGHLYKFFYRN